MADTFFGFDTSLSRDEECAGNLEDELEEQEYDALNDETFGDPIAPGTGAFDDWEAQHEQLAKITENRRKTSHEGSIAQSLSKLVNDEESDSDSDYLLNLNSINTNNIWAAGNDFQYQRPNDVLRTGSLPPSLPPTTSHQIHQRNSVDSALVQQKPNPNFPNGLSLPKNVCTVEELERGLLTNRIPNATQNAPIDVPKPQFMPNFPLPRYPPGLNSMGSMILTPYNMPPGLNAQNAPNLLRFLTPHPLLMQRPGIPNPPPGLQNLPPPPGLPPPNMIRHNMNMKNQMPQMNRVNNYPNQNFKNFRSDFPQQSFQPYNHLRPQFHIENQYLQQNHQQMQHNMNRGLNNRNNNFVHPNQQQQLYHQLQQHLHQRVENQDEYAGLMSTREKQWLLNIQLLQLNTGTPYFDDFYYTVFVDRQNKLEKENRPNQDPYYMKNNRYQNHHNNRHNQNRKDEYSKDDRMHRDRDNNPTHNNPIHRTYTPLQFENSLGKLQCGSVTAPRKIIDMDIVPHEKESELNATQNTVNLQRDLRKTKQTLLELEGLFGLVLRLEDLNNPIAIANTLKLREIKEKQKIQQLETATMEEKEEILKALQEDSLVKNDNRDELLTKIFSGLLFEDKINNYLGVRKGKVLLLRLLPLLCKEYFDKHLELWIKILSSLPTNGRKDQLSDNILPSFFHFFERFVEQLNMDSLLKIVSTLIDMRKPENQQTAPTASRNLLLLLFYSKLGLSCIAKLIIQSEQLFVRLQVSASQRSIWCTFLTSILETIEIYATTPQHHTSPLQLIDNCVMETHLKHTLVIPQEKIHLFLNVFCIQKS